MSNCPIERPQCKRKVMNSDKPYEKQQCPLNIKPRCSLIPPGCPLLPQENICGLSKLQDSNMPLDVSQCPGRSPCCLVPKVCPIPPIQCSEMPDDGKNTPKPDPNRPCPIESCQQNKSPEEQKASKRKKEEKLKQIESEKNVMKGKCPVSATRRPLPCSECILDELSTNAAGDNTNKTKCPFIKIADMCGACCNCEEVPDAIVDPQCPFLPKPCSCCTTPRCPLTRKPDCLLNPKPDCCLLKPPCYCSKNCLGQCSPCPSSNCPPLTPCSCRMCSMICFPLFPPKCICGSCIGQPKCLLTPKCVCGSCPAGLPKCLFTPPGCSMVSPKCVCGTCPAGLPKCLLTPPGCPMVYPKCVCGSCPAGLPKCLLTPLGCPMVSPKCVCGTCPAGLPKCLFSSPVCSPVKCSCGTCPLAIPCCLPSPPCICGLCPFPIPAHTCPLVQDPCPLLKTPICPPIPPPCSLNKYELEANPPKTTFHVPLCPEYKPPCKIHLTNTGKGDSICPFSPHPCPLGATCPFPIPVVESKKSAPQTITTNKGITNKKKSPDENKECPGYPTCGIIPHPQCPAAEILCPEKYRKKELVKKEPCPFKQCMKKPECPFNQAMPNVDCPMADDSNCPLAKEPECPVAELANRCPLVPKCMCLPLPACPLSKSKTDCPLTSKTNCIINKGSEQASQPTPKQGCLLSPAPNCPFVTEPKCPLTPKPDCPISKFMPKTIEPGCPLVPKPKCPLILKPDCPLAEFNPKSDCQSKPKTSKNGSECIITQIVSNKTPSREVSTAPKFDGKMLSQKNKEPIADCPLSHLAPKRNCLLAPPECPLTPKPACPLTAKLPPCPLTLKKPYCPIEYGPCKKFPEGRCPMGDLNLCDCDYPVSPCLIPPQVGHPDVVAPSQYCIKENCCMGLGLPPVNGWKKIDKIKEKEKLFDNSFYYKFSDTKPGKEETKHYVQVLTEAPKVQLSLFGEPKKRLHDNWSVIKYGEGFKRCKTINKKLMDMGPIENVGTQYNIDDCPLDEETIRILENRKKHERDVKEIEAIKQSLGLKSKKDRS